MADPKSKLSPEDALQSLAQSPKSDPLAALEAQRARSDSRPAGEADVAAALDAKAFRPKVGKEDALEQMASGQWKEQEHPPRREDDSQDEAEAEIVEPGRPAEPAAAPSGGRRIQIVRQPYAGGMKKFLVPPLLVTGVLLWILGGAVGFLSLTGKLGPSSTLRTLMVVSAFPMGAFLMLGAWLFHQESKSK